MAATASSSDFVYVVCLIHLVLCIIYIACLTPGDAPLKLGGVLIYPTLQWINTAFQCVSIVGIIMGGVGNLYLIQSHVDVYFFLLRLALLGDIAWIVVFAVFGDQCVTKPSQLQHFATTVQCSISSGWVIVCLVLVALFKCVGIYSVLMARRNVRKRYNEELAPYLKKQMDQPVMGAEVNEQLQAPTPAFPGAVSAKEVESQQFFAPAPQPSLSFRSMTDPRTVSAAAPGFEYGAVRSASMQKANPNSAPAVTSVPPMMQA